MILTTFLSIDYVWLHSFKYDIITSMFRYFTITTAAASIIGGCICGNCLITSTAFVMKHALKGLIKLPSKSPVRRPQQIWCSQSL